MGQPLPAGRRPEPRGGRDRRADKGRQTDNADSRRPIAAPATVAGPNRCRPTQQRDAEQRRADADQGQSEQGGRPERRPEKCQRQREKRQTVAAGGGRRAEGDDPAGRRRLAGRARHNKKETEVQVLCYTIIGDPRDSQ